MFRNPIMFIVEVVTFVMLFVTIWAVATGDTTQGSFGYNMLVFIVLFATLLFANFAEAIAEARGKAQADSLRRLVKRLRLVCVSVIRLRLSVLLS